MRKGRSTLYTYEKPQEEKENECLREKEERKERKKRNETKREAKEI